MIEGWRLTPWKQGAARMNPDGFLHLNNCELCMQENPKHVRQTMRCGYEQLLPIGPDVSAWQPPSAPDEKYGYEGPAAQYCIAYTSQLPEVVEVEQAWRHWKTGHLVEWCGGKQPTETLMRAILMMDGQIGAVEAWVLAQKSDRKPSDDGWTSLMQPEGES